MISNEFIRQLSLDDKKNLSQKALKTCEEVGELAKAVLPYESAPGTNHRFIDKYKILEEVADVYLTSMSIAYCLGFSDEEIEGIINQKSLKWSELLSRESESKFPLPFEIHITVDGSEMCDPIMFDRKRFDIDYFKQVCQSIGVKPIVLDLEIPDGVIKDTMTSSKHFGDNRSVYDESQRIVYELKEAGFEVLRTKIETVPWHPAAPKKWPISNPSPVHLPNNCYFESHIGVSIYPNQKEDLSKFVEKEFNGKELGDHLNIKLKGIVKLSQNFFKKSIDGSKFINMITYRSTTSGSEEFKRYVDLIKQTLNAGGYEFEKVEVEYAIYDTNVSHDANWLKNLETVK